MPFGLKNAPAVFQRVMDKVLGHLECCSPYIDDIIVFSDGWADHLVDLRRVLGALREKGLTVNVSKCSFGMKYVKYLGHIVGSAVPAARSEAFRNYKQPDTKKQLQSLLSAFSYFRKFIPGFANRSSVLSPSTSEKAP